MNALTRTLVATAVVALGTQLSLAQAENLHCVPKEITVTNKKPASIKVLKLKYKVAGSETVYTEGLNNKKLAPNEQEEWKNQRLNHAADGIVVTDTAIEYKNDNSGAGDGYGPPVTSKWFPHTYACGSKHTYNHEID